MTAVSTIVDASGKPFVLGNGMGRASAGVPAPDGTTMVPGMGYGMYPYDASQIASQEFGEWNPQIRSPDSEINQFRDRMVARSRDLTRNSGWASGGIVRILDNVVGTNLRLLAQPDYRALALRFGVKAFDAVWADEFRHAVEALWRGYADNPRRWNDVSEKWTVGQQFRLALRHKLIDGDSLFLSYWLPERCGYGGADYATAFMLVDPDRLSNPYQAMDTKFMRGGVEVDARGVPVAYHVREAEQYDWYNVTEANRWERVPRYDTDGWRRVIHDFDADRAGQNRGIGVFSPVITHMKMLAKYYGVELQQATISAIFGTYVTSPFDPALVGDALGAGDIGSDDLGLYQTERSKWSQERPAMLNGARVPTLFPGEKIESVASAHPHTNFPAFAHEMMCLCAAALGMSVEQITQDWSRVNYSSARASLAETWKTFMRRRGEFAANTATPVYGTWLEEAMELGELPLPAGAPDYVEATAAYSKCQWLGPPRGFIDPTKEPAGAILRLEAGTSTLKAEAAEQGQDWEEVLEERALENAAYKRAGVPVPAWGNVNGVLDPAGSGDETIQDNSQGGAK
jgi:lambda family phage portal protein